MSTTSKSMSILNDMPPSFQGSCGSVHPAGSPSLHHRYRQRRRHPPSRRQRPTSRAPNHPTDRPQEVCGCLQQHCKRLEHRGQRRSCSRLLRRPSHHGLCFPQDLEEASPILVDNSAGWGLGNDHRSARLQGFVVYALMRPLIISCVILTIFGCTDIAALFVGLLFDSMPTRVGRGVQEWVQTQISIRAIGES